MTERPPIPEDLPIERAEPRLEQPVEFIGQEAQRLTDAATEHIREKGNDPEVYRKSQSVIGRHMRGTALALSLFAAKAGLMPATAEAGERGEGRRVATEIGAVVLGETSRELEQAYYDGITDLQNMEFAWEGAETEKQGFMTQIRQLDEDIALAERNAEAARADKDAGGVYEALEFRQRLIADQNRMRARIQDRTAFQRALERRMSEVEKGQKKKKVLGVAARVGSRVFEVLGR
jgi:hypothetical protein